MVALIISLAGNFSELNLIYTLSIEMSTGSEINDDLHDGVEISLGTPVGGLKLMAKANLCNFVRFKYGLAAILGTSLCR